MTLSPMADDALRIGTRGSALAMAQAREVGDPPGGAARRPGRAGPHLDRRRPRPRSPRRHRWSGCLRQRRTRRGGATARWTSPCTRSRTCRRRPTVGSSTAAIPTRQDPRDALVARGGLIPRRAARRLHGRHRLAAPCRAAPRARARARRRRDPRQRGHPAADGGRGRRSTPSWSPAPACSGSAGRTRSPRRSTRCRCCRPPGRAPWPSRSPRDADELRGDWSPT